VVVVSVTEAGRSLAARLPYEHVHGDAGGTVAARWKEVDGFVLVLALGACVRLIAPHLAGKEIDPAVVCVDDAGRFAIPVCGAHAAGANELAVAVAGLLGAEPVVTTASDRLEVPALDRLPGLGAEGDLAAVTTALLDRRPVGLSAELPWPLPPALADRLDQRAPPEGPLVVVSDRLAEAPDDRPTVRLRPPSLAVGVGTTTDADPAALLAAVAEALEDASLAPASVGAVATIDRRADHPAVGALARAYRAPVRAFAPAALDAVTVPAPSEVVRAAVGTASVAEAAALLAAGPEATLVLGKRVRPGVTVAVARRVRPPGSVTVVGLGPGDPAHRTPAAVAAVRHAEAVVGLDAYVEQCADLLAPAQLVRRFPLGAEVDRATEALRLAAAGRRVALVCSGDAGIYGMASPLLELAGEHGGAPVEVAVVPGVHAALAAAAALGAPLGHDHLVVSLSDLLTPWDLIEARVRAAAETDLVLAIFNPRSAKRTWQLPRVRDLLLEARPGTTPVGLVSDVGRPGETVAITTLAELDVESVTMTTCVVVGASTTRLVGGRMVTPRGYRSRA
jgi:cobalt-precorrin 5A hydrolase/precorrin-3B C17-methyltransferase